MHGLKQFGILILAIVLVLPRRALSSDNESLSSKRVIREFQRNPANTRSILNGGDFIGCFDTWFSTEKPHPFEAHFRFETSCIQQCLIRAANMSEVLTPWWDYGHPIALVKGSYCVCTIWERNSVNQSSPLHELQRVDTNYCDLPCPTQHRCGGTFGFSGFVLAEEGGASIEAPTFETSVVDVYKDDLSPEAEPTLEPENRCARCFEEEIPDVCAQYEDWSEESPGNQFALLNSPLNCINYCRRFIKAFPQPIADENMEFGRIQSFAFLGPKQFSDNYYPACRCFTAGRGQLEYLFYPETTSRCDLRCEGNPDFHCGGDPLETVKYTIYRISFDKYYSGGTSPSLNPHVTPTACDWKACQEYDHYSRYWEGRPGEVIFKTCPNNNPKAAGTSSWECLPNGHFAGESPNYTDCSSGWLTELQPIPFEPDSIYFLEGNTSLAKNPSLLDSQYYAHEILNVLELLKEITVEAANKEDYEHMKLVTNSGLNTIHNILTHFHLWTQLSASSRPLVATETLRTLDFALLQLVHSRQLKSDPDYNYNLGNGNSFIVRAGIWDSLYQDSLTFPLDCSGISSCITVSAGEWMDDLPGQSVMFAAVQIDSSYFQNKIPGSINRLGVEGTAVISKILNTKYLMGFSLFQNQSKEGVRVTALTRYEVGQYYADASPKISIGLSHNTEVSGSKSVRIRRKLHPGEKVRAVGSSGDCVFWDEVHLVWSTDGCSRRQATRTATVCECNHFTYFGLLMSLHEYEEKGAALEVLTWVLSSLSVLTLLVSIISYCADVDPSPQTTITKHLSLILVLGSVSMMLIVDRNYFWLENEGACIAASIITQYLFLSAFMLMTAEAYICYQMVIRVFDVEELNVTRVWLVAYGAPVVVLVGTGVISSAQGEVAFGGLEFCWLEGNYAWSFVGPVTVILIVNLVTICCVVRTAYTSQKAMGKTIGTNVLKIRIRGILSLIFTLGLSWLFGYFILLPDSTASTVFEYIFTILSAGQGICIAVFHSFLKKKARKDLMKVMLRSTGLLKYGGPNILEGPIRIPKPNFGKCRFRNPKPKTATEHSALNIIYGRSSAPN